MLSSLAVFVRRLDESRNPVEVTYRGLELIEDMFGFSHSMLLMAYGAPSSCS